MFQLPVLNFQNALLKFLAARKHPKLVNVMAAAEFFAVNGLLHKSSCLHERVIVVPIKNKLHKSHNHFNSIRPLYCL